MQEQYERGLINQMNNLGNQKYSIRKISYL
jgi:hypothetical protein